MKAYYSRKINITYCVYIIFITIFILCLLLHNYKNKKNIIEEPFIGKHIRPHIRRIRLAAEEHFGNYGRYGLNLLKRKGFL